MTTSKSRYSLLSPVLLAALALAGSSACATRPAAGPAPIARHDAGEQFVMMERMTTQIDRATREIPAERYTRVTRPHALALLHDAGFSERDAAEIMSRVDDARADRVRMARLWRGESDPGAVTGRSVAITERR